MHCVILVDLVTKDPPLIKSLYSPPSKSELFELVINLSLRHVSSVSIYCLYPETYKCIYPCTEKGKGLSAEIASLNQVRLTEEGEVELDEMQALAGICIRSLLSLTPDTRILILSNFLPRWSTSTLDFARARLTLHSASDRVQTKRLLHALLDEVSPLRFEAVLSFSTDSATPPPIPEIHLTLTPAVALSIQNPSSSPDPRQIRISLYMVDLVLTASVEFQLCVGTPWIGVVEDPQAITLMNDLQEKGVSILCSSPYHCETFETRPYPCFYVCIPAQVGDGSLLLKQVSVREHIRCFDRPESNSLMRDPHLSDWVLSTFPSKTYNPLDYSNHFFEYTAGQCLATNRVPQSATVRQEARVEQVPKPLNTLDKLTSMFESVAVGRKGKKAGGKMGN